MRQRFIFGGMVMAALLYSSPAWAQVGGGIKVGVNLATLSDFNDASPTKRVGIVAGGFVTVGLAPMIAFEPEVLFSMQGSKLHFGTSPLVSSDATTELDYIQVPLLIRIGNSGKAGASLYAIAGPTFGILVRDNQDAADELKTTDLGVAVGAGVTVSRLLLEGRYTAGLTDLNKGGTGHKNRVISLLVGLHF